MNISDNFENYILNKRDKIKISSKDIIKGDIFLALKGKKYHGNRFINQALKNGAKFCLTDNKRFKKNKKILLVNDIFDYLTKLAVKKRNLYNGKVIGITGSAGKTTLKETLAFFLKKNYLISFSKKSYNNKLGVLVSLLNLNLKSSYAIFELGTNNFGEIKNLTNIVKPQEIFITNIQSTHLENFKNKKNIAKEKSDIFVSKHNNYASKLYLNVNNEFEKIILNKANKEKNLKIIKIGNSSRKYYFKKIVRNNKNYKVDLIINGKNLKLDLKTIVNTRLNNLLFCYAFFAENFLRINTITKTLNNLKPVLGRGSIHKIIINNKKIKVIDESYNANPDTMAQSIEYFNNFEISHTHKILILGNMNELGDKSERMHLDLLSRVNQFKFKFVILCGEFLRRSIKKMINRNNNYLYFENKNKIMNFLKLNLNKGDAILIKCSNSTEVNKLSKKLLQKGNLA